MKTYGCFKPCQHAFRNAPDPEISDSQRFRSNDTLRHLLDIPR